MFYTTQEILKGWYPPEEFRLVTTYGPLGYGKSCFVFKMSIQIIQEVYEIDVDLPLMKALNAWEYLKQFIVFHPEQFFTKLDDIELSGLNRIPFVDWDDAGLWLYALDWNDPFIKALGKYLNVARSRLASIIMTTPTPDMIFSKMRKFPQALNVSIIKEGSGGRHLWHRVAKPYVQYHNIVKGYRVTRLKHKGDSVVEDFNCRMPDKFYSWYKPLRDSYEQMALELIKEKWREAQQSDATLLGNYPQLQVPTLTRYKGVF